MTTHQRLFDSDGLNDCLGNCLDDFADRLGLGLRAAVDDIAISVSVVLSLVQDSDSSRA